MADTAEKVLKKHFSGIPGKIDRVKEPQHLAMGTGSGIVVVAETNNGNRFGASALGRRHIPPFQVGDAAALELVEDVENQSCVDKHLQDQVICWGYLLVTCKRYTHSLSDFFLPVDNIHGFGQR